MRAFTFGCIIVLASLMSGCSKSAVPAITTPTGTLSLNVNLKGQLAGSVNSISGMVTLSNGSVKVSQTVDPSGVTEFRNLSAGSYNVTGVADFGYNQKDVSVVVGDGANVVDVVLEARYELRLLSVTMNGRTVVSGDMIDLGPSGAEVSVDVKVMNIGRDGQLGLLGMIEKFLPNNGGVANLGRPMRYRNPLPVGVSQATMSGVGFRPCVWDDPAQTITTVCYDRSENIYIGLVNLAPNGFGPMHANIGQMYMYR